MKKFGKLSISPEKIMKNEELLNLQGGYQGYCCRCTNGTTWYGFMLDATASNCDSLCKQAYGWHSDVYGDWIC